MIVDTIEQVEYFHYLVRSTILEHVVCEDALRA